ncbi:bifunctional biotin--[acetyl-CoA-carboxylase] ligase/biotin operon repressor BirA [Lacimicrobium sp. SS2-24]|uniref:bifunctional biotin--[acetyl-CoA-carboxylase] ligase/biotin operon repressor BirA n=1 Tax=Lacimicrobium sp. SS2-24 TaxID=2005569 RepID=UPI000B4B3267|nr:bifunctional biotin--[acetyl-CoA-carboxylase] ligase/biotin operon repressor BirA [Lacimicrobium sp. SS2-24]
MSRTPQATRNSILLKLIQGGFYSGERLGNELGISRAAVSKHIHSLMQLGLDIFSVTGKGYKLATKLQLMDAQLIRSYCQHYDAPLDLLNVVDSTNSYLKQTADLHKPGGCCLAEAQTAGRGRQGKHWVSPFGASLYLSMYWGFLGGYQAIGGLSLAVGVAVVRALRHLGYDTVQLKWPNDVYLNGKKLAGILVEVEGQLDDTSHCFIGVGLNIQLPANQTKQIDQPWTDLHTESGQPVDRNRLAACLLDELFNALGQFSEHGLAVFMQEWHRSNLYENKKVRLLCGPKEFTGTCLGINEQGALVVETENGKQLFYGGEISVRPHA